MKLSTRIHEGWREAEDVVTAATGPLLILASIIATADIFSNHAFSLRMTWLPVVWALSRAAATVIWLGVAFGFYLDARRRGESSFWWLVLALMMFTVDLQTGLLFASQIEHISNAGELAILNMPTIDWVLETGFLGVILIAVHRAVEHQTHSDLAPVTQPFPERHSLQPVDEAAGMRSRGAPTAQRAYYTGPIAPLMMDDEDNGMLELVSDEDEPRGLTRQTPRRRRPRRDAGSESSAKEQRIQRLMAQLRLTPRMTIDDVVDFLNVSRGTAVTDRREAKQRLAQKRPV